MSGLAIRRYQPGDEIGIVNLFDKVFGKTKPLDLWRWEFLRNPYGTVNVTLAVNEKDQVVAHAGGVVIRFNDRGTPIRASHSVDAMIEPNSRKMGLFTRTGRAYFKNTAEDQIKFLYGFPSPLPLKLEQRLLGFEPIEPVNQWAYDMRCSDFLRSRLAFLKCLGDGREGLSIGRVGQFGTETDRFWEEIKEDYPCATVRDSQYMNWRYVDKPHGRYERILATEKYSKRTVGVMILEGDKNNGLILDLLTSPGDRDTALSLLKFSIAFFASQKKKAVLLWSSRKGKLEKFLKQAGFKTRNPQLTLVLKTLDPSVDLPFLRENFYYSMGDSDLY